MVYDNTKLIHAFNRWLEDRCELKFGRTYTGALYADFLDYLEGEDLLKGPPGPVPFGKCFNGLIADDKVERTRTGSSTFYTGICLKTPREVEPRMYRPNREAISSAASALHAIDELPDEPPPQDSEDDEEARIKRFYAEAKASLQSEEPDNDD